MMFTFGGQRYHYFYHPYNTTWRNERAAEIPIVLAILRQYSGQQVLEVGNVLSHYFFVNHDVIDKYEKWPGVINVDAADYRPSLKYDLIVSISTMEHVGWDEQPHDSAKIMRTIRNLKSSLAPKAKLVLTLPVGYNMDLDRLLDGQSIGFSEKRCLKRISKDNRWVEVSWEDIRCSSYGHPFPAANGLVVGIIVNA